MVQQPKHPLPVGKFMSKDLKQLVHHFADLTALKRALMTFVQGGGVFVPTEVEYHLGDIVAVELTLPETNTVFKFNGEIIWVTPNLKNGAHNTGIGIQCNEDEGEAFQKTAQQL